jgi:hypothetical protein
MPAPATATARTPTAPAPEPGPQSTGSATPLADRADIRPLDVPAALQILLAEVRAAFELQALALGQDTSETPSAPPQAARALLQLVLGAMPEETGAMAVNNGEPAWNAALLRVETALQAGLDRGIDAVTAWRDVPPVVVAAAKDARALVFSALGEDPNNPVWLRPEWAGLAPKLERFWRRRRRRRAGHLTDPDQSFRSIDDDSEPRT